MSDPNAVPPPFGGSAAPGQPGGAPGQPAWGAPAAGGPPTGGAPYGGQPTSGGPYGGQPTSGGPYGGQPTSGGPYGGQPTSAPPTSGAPYGGQPTSGAPFGGQPFGGQPAGGPPFGTPPPGGQPFGGPTATPPAPPKSGGAKKTLFSILGVIVALVVVGVIKFAANGLFNDDATEEAKAGDCIGSVDAPKEGETTDASGAKVVDCGSADAKYQVLGRVDGKTRADFDADQDGTICTEAGFGDAKLFIWSGRTGQTGYILCLTDKQ